jgi:hypothetical protein
MRFALNFKANLHISPLLKVQDRLRQPISNEMRRMFQMLTRLPRKVQLLSTLKLPSAPPADGDMSKLTPDYFVKKGDDHALDYFSCFMNPVLETSR